MAAVADDYWYTRQPTIIALLEAGCWTSEIPAVRICDCDDLDNPTTVAVAGSTRTSARTCVLTDWGQRILRARIRLLRKKGASGVTPLVYEGEKAGTASPQASVCTATREVVKRAGLGREPDLKPHSVAGWAGRTLFDQVGDVVAMARYLGLRNLDRAARVIQLN
jgi:hypothetical protein